jgi:hypothetical protein
MACLAFVAIPLPALGASAATGPTVQVPEPEKDAAGTDTATPIQRPAESVPPSTDSTTPSAPADATAESAPASGEAPAKDDALSADMLETSPPATSSSSPSTSASATAPAPRVDEDEELSPSEAITKKYAPRYRPGTNPTRINFVVRGLFANAGGSKISGGRLGGVAADIGTTWNHFGVAATGTVYGGRVGLRESTNAEINAMIGIGPTVGLGRIVLLGRGFLDLRLGYDFYYAVVNQRSSETIVAAQDPGDVSVTKAKNLIPHGPRVRLDLGLLSLDTNRRFFHGFGVSMGYQALVGSMNGGLPPTHMLTLGLTYWMG